MVSISIESAQDGILFIHGDVELPDLENAGMIIMGHEHPAIALFDEIGAKEKIKAFLAGKFGEKELIVLPAFSPLAQGTEINLIPREELLSPLLKDHASMDSLKVIGLVPIRKI